MTRGTVVRSQKPTMRSFVYLASADNLTNALVDDELARKRGDGWEALLPKERSWPRRSALRTTAGLLTREAYCGEYQWAQERGMTCRLCGNHCCT